jgi:hypothetical protein
MEGVVYESSNEENKKVKWVRLYENSYAAYFRRLI